MTDEQNVSVEAKMTEQEILQALASKDSMIVRQAAFEAGNQSLKSALPLLVKQFESQSMGIIEAVEVAVRKIRGEEAAERIEQQKRRAERVFFARFLQTAFFAL